MKLRIATLAVVVFALAARLPAQVRSGTVEISPFYGYLFGGSFPAGSNALFSSRVDVRDHFTYGVGLGYFITSAVQVEARWARTETRFRERSGNHILQEDSLGVRLPDLTIDYFMGYGTFHFGHRRAVPYVTLGLGAARLDPGDVTVYCTQIIGPCPSLNPPTSTRFTASAGGGVKIYANRHLGFRFDGRYYVTYLNSRNGHCDVFGESNSCSNARSNNRYNWLGNVETTGGLVISF